MPLGVISRVSFGFGVIFGEKSQKGKTGNFAFSGAAASGALTTVRPGCQNGTPSGTLWHSCPTPQQSATP